MFRFKQFSISHKQSSMKVGSDAIMLACWANVSFAKSLLDVGTGCGIIALILAQRNPDAIIHAIDIDPSSVEEAGFNFKASPWSKRLSVQQMLVQDLAQKAEKYDFIISNPPYFVNSLKAYDNQRNFARHADDTLPFSELLNSVAEILLDDGRFVCILPAPEADIFRKEAKKKDLYCCRLTRIVTVENGNLQRYLMEFSKQENDCITDQFSIINADGRYSSWYKDLTKDFYIDLP